MTYFCAELKHELTHDKERDLIYYHDWPAQCIQDLQESNLELQFLQTIFM